jgi:hypothetical protein
VTQSGCNIQLITKIMQDYVCRAKRFCSVRYFLFLHSKLMNIFQKGSHACNTHFVISPNLINIFTIDHCRAIASAARENRYLLHLRVQIIVLDAQLFLWPQLIRHVEYSLSQVQKLVFGLTAYLIDNKICLSYEGQLWREIINVSEN